MDSSVDKLVGLLFCNCLLAGFPVPCCDGEAAVSLE
jgi:hypothetical protein